MKFTQISTLALAAMMAFSSCSKEEVMNPGEADLQPGEARIVLDLGRKGATTYSTIAAETAIKNGDAKLFTAAGDSIPARFTLIGTKLSATVSADYANEKGVTLFAYVNASTLKDATAGASAMAKHAAATVVTAIDRDLKEGAPAGIKTEPFDLVPGKTATIKQAPLLRAIARVAAKNGNTAADALPINGYKISFSGVNLTSGALYAGATNADSAIPGTSTLPDYDLKLDGKVGDATTLTGGFETVAYMYPSSEVTATVTPKDGTAADAKTVKFTPKANMNYTISITPKKTESGEVSFEVSISKEWDKGGDLNVDFNDPVTPPDPSAPKMKLQPGFKSGSASVQDGVLVIETNGVTSLSFDVKDLIGDVSASYNELNAIMDAKTTRAAGDMTGDIPDHKTLTLTYPAIYKDITREGTLTIFANHTSNLTGVALETLEIPVIVKGIALPAEYLVNMGSVEFVSINSQGTLTQDLAMIDKIKKQGTGTFAQKIMSYIMSNTANFAEATGKKFPNNAAAVAACPAGFKLASTADFKSLLANTLNTMSNGAFGTVNPIQYNVAALKTFEPITDGARKVVTTDYKVGCFATNLVGGDPACKAFRVVDYKDNWLILSVLATADVYGGIYTKEGNIAINGSGTSKTMFTINETILDQHPNFQGRCVKDTAANAIW